MFKSMTGFGNSAFSSEMYLFEIEAKSLNSRFLDISVRMPKEISQHEFAIRDLVKKNILRGKIAINININSNLSQGNNNLDETELVNSFNILKKIMEKTNIDEEITLKSLLLFRDSFLIQDNSLADIDSDLILDSVQKALTELNKMREYEGAQLKEDLIFRIENVENHLKDIENISANSTEEYFTKFKDKAEKLVDEFIDDQNRFLLELGILSEKHDVTEECTRLKSHIKLFTETLKKNEDIGRSLNFICQEMNREVNTINSKSISSEISHLGIAIKEELEKIREQVQNIE